MKKFKRDNYIKSNINKAILSLDTLKGSIYLNKINKICNEMIKTLKKGNKIIFCGNGGSAADSQHLCAELVSKFLKNRKPLAAISLTTNTSSITSIANDFNFEQVFSKQIEAIGKNGDFLFAISTSGKSKNIIRAVSMAKKRGLKTFLLTGQSNAKKISTNMILEVPANRVDRVQELHIFIGHVICEIIENSFS